MTQMRTDNRCFFTLKHMPVAKKEVSKDEWMYFLECLQEKREYNMETKMSITTKPPQAGKS